jgi:hypothetical protein
MCPHNRLIISGEGFSQDLYTGGNFVSVGPYPCHVVHHLTSDTLITCETVAGDAGSYPISVIVDGTYQDSQCCFNFSPNLTPCESTVSSAMEGHLSLGTHHVRRTLPVRVHEHADSCIKGR